MAAVLARKTSGHGQHLDVAAQQSVAQATLSGILAAAIAHDNYAVLRDLLDYSPGQVEILEGVGALV